MAAMKAGVLLLFWPLLCGAYTVISSDSHVPVPLHCSFGQAYWCKNITTAAECRAVKHCIKSVWEQQVPIELDGSTVCETCLEMVKEARDQLESNETQSEIRQVLEATCKVIPIHALREDCNKLMDDFGSYLVDTLASEMNPQVVCSVAGLCNNPAFYKPKLNCEACFGLMRQVEDKIDTASENDIRTALVSVCRSFGSYSDGCAALVIQNLPQIAALIGENVKALPVCSLAGVCKEKFHFHAKLQQELGESKDVEVIGGGSNDDLPCDLCEQLVKHLRDILIANTTEAEFKLVLLGLCNQMKDSYKTECQELVKNYYDVAYGFLVNELDGKILCTQIGICPKAIDDVMIRPLIPGDLTLPPALQTPSYQLPVSVLDPLTILPKALLNQPEVENRELCSFCEYFLHFIQQEITLPSSEMKIREVIEKGCDLLPASISQQCNSFVETYSASFIALLANRIDPSQVCPGLGICPGKLILVTLKDKPTCPLCLLAMEELLHKISNRTEEDINDALDDLCIRDVFPNSLTTECAGFVNSYRQPLTDMILAGFTSEEACLYSDVCSLPQPLAIPQKKDEPIKHISSNEINTDHKDKVADSNSCVLCEFIMTKLEKILKDRKTQEEIKEGVFKVCSYMPHTVTAQCKHFVEEYADLIIELITNEVTPKEICTAINLCEKASTLISAPVRKCLTCEVLMESLKVVLTDLDVDDSFNHKLLRACHELPMREIATCQGIVRELAPQIESALRNLPVGPLVCHRIGLCGSPHCSLGPAFWCASKENAALCQEREYCQSKDKDTVRAKSVLKGTHVI